MFGGAPRRGAQKCEAVKILHSRVVAHSQGCRNLVRLRCPDALRRVADDDEMTSKRDHQLINGIHFLSKKPVQVFKGPGFLGGP